MSKRPRDAEDWFGTVVFIVLALLLVKLLTGFP